MAKAIISKFKKFVVFVLIIVMVTPTIVLGTFQTLFQRATSSHFDTVK